LRIAASYTIAEYLAPSWLLDLQRMHPDAEVHLEVTNSAHVVERLVCKEVDIGFIETSTIPEVLVGTVVARDELVVVTRPDHALAQRAGVTVSMLSSFPLILRERGSGTREVWEVAAQNAGCAMSAPLLELGSTSAVKRAVLDGAGPGVVSYLAVESEVQRGELVILPIADVDLRRDLRAVWAVNATLKPLACALLNAAQVAGPSNTPLPGGRRDDFPTRAREALDAARSNSGSF